MKLVFTMFAAVFSISTAIAQNVGIGTTTPVNKLSVVGKVNITDSLGVGTTTPASVLHLQSANVSDTSRGDIILSRYWNGNTDTRASSIFHYNNTDRNSDNLAFGVAGNGGSLLRPNALSQIKMLIQANGNVGIGTLTPAEKLDVAGTIKTTNLQVISGADNGYILRSDANGNASWANASTIETDPKVGTLTSNKIPKWNGTALTDGLLFDNGTNVGIGTTLPAYKMTIVNPFGAGIAALSNSATSNTSIGIGRTNLEGSLNVAGNTNEFAIGSSRGDIVLRTESNAQRVILNSGSGGAALTVLDGNTGIGTTTPGNKLSVNGNSDISGNLGIGTSSPTEKLDVFGTTKTVNLQITNGASNGFILKSDANGIATWVNANTLTVAETDPKVGTLTGNKIPKWNGVKLTDGLVYDNGTRVGIGTVLPFNNLSVVGNSDISGNLGIGTNSPLGRLHIANSGDAQLFIENTDARRWSLQSNALGVGINTTFQIIDRSLGFSRFGIDDNGNIGIGNTAPTQKLDVAGTTKTTSLQITSGAANGYVLKSDATGNASWVNPNTLTLTETDPKVGTLTSNKIPKWNGTTLADGLVFDNGTNVGIGTTTPANKLSVIGNSDISGNLGIGTTSPSNKLSVNGNSDISGNLGIGTTTPFNKLSVNGNSDITGTLGIGTTVPAAKLHVASTSTGLRIDVPATQTAFSIGGAGSVKVDAIGIEGGRLLINDNGYVGIGNTNPITTLDVNGGIRTKYSGTVVFDVVGGGVRSLSIPIPVVPGDWNINNTIVTVTNADGVDGIVRQARLSNTTTIDVKYFQDTNGPVRLNWVIFRM